MVLWNLLHRSATPCTHNNKHQHYSTTYTVYTTDYKSPIPTMESVLPKKRSAQGSRVPSGALHDLSNKGRVLSEKQKRITSNRHVSRGDMFVDDANSSFGEDAIHFHENRSTIMSNFEEWIKLSTDNKITSKNSWQFALIDYFHDLNVIKDGDNINFQRASATLDGCVKIYLSRVESVASETGKLLSGLATKKGQAMQEAEEDDENDDANAETGKKERRINRVVESTLVPFETLKVKKLDQELAIDPLFKKALADFDEGGAKSLLLNTLNIDASGRVVFDATTSSINEQVQKNDTSESSGLVNLSKLRGVLGAVDLDDLTICPSLPELRHVLSDVGNAKSMLSNVNSRFAEKETETPLQEELNFGETNYEASEPNLPNLDEPNLPDYDMDMDFDDKDANDGLDLNMELESTTPHEVVSEKVMDQDLMAYFDEKMKTNWRGPEHWRVTALKQAKKLDKPSGTPQPEPVKRKRKEKIIVDFFEEDDGDILEDLFQKHKNQFQISKRPEERKSEDLHILPDDIKFNLQRLVNLFIKPAYSIVTFSRRMKPLLVTDDDEESNRIYTDENYFAGKYMEKEKEREEEERQERLAASFHQAEMEDYDNYGGIDFNDVLGGADDVADSEEKEEVGSQFVTSGRKARPEYVNFSRVAKRVDVKLLKDNLWKSIKTELLSSRGADEDKTDETKAEETRTFRGVVDVIGGMYRPEEKKELSTSFCFICLLHLANEHGLSIESTETQDDLVIKGF